METSGSSSQTPDHSQVHGNTEDVVCMSAFSDPLGKASWEVESSNEWVEQRTTLLSSAGTMAQVTVETSKEVVILHTCTHTYVLGPVCPPVLSSCGNPQLLPNSLSVSVGLGWY